MGGDGVEPPEPKHLIYSQARYPYGISTLIMLILFFSKGN